MRYRRNIDCLTPEQLHELRSTLATMYSLPPEDPYSFQAVARLHGGPPTAYCVHGAPGFLTWHRAELMAFEAALRANGCMTALPFWDWTSGGVGVPLACRDPTYIDPSGTPRPNTLYAGPRPNGTMTVRSATANTTSFAGPAATAATALSAPTFASFQSQLNGAHGWVHGLVGGDMGSIGTASFDPIFHLHHANVDRLWAKWQASHPGPMPAAEANNDLVPFPRAYDNDWQRGADVATTQQLGYAYQYSCYFLRPPFVLKDLVLPFDFPLRQRLDSVRVVLESHHVPQSTVVVRAVLDELQSPAADEAMRTVQAGSVGLFGTAPPQVMVALEKAEVAQAPPMVVQASGGVLVQKGAGRHAAAGSKTTAHKAEAARATPPSEGGHGHHGPGGHDHGHDGHAHEDEERLSPHAQQARLHGNHDVEIDITAAFLAAPPKASALRLRLVPVDVLGQPVGPERLKLDGVQVIIE